MGQYRDVKLLYKEYVGDEIVDPFISYPHINTKYPIQIIDLRFQVDHITPKKFVYLKNKETNPPTIQTMLEYLLYSTGKEKKN